MFYSLLGEHWNRAAGQIMHPNKSLMAFTTSPFDKSYKARAKNVVHDFQYGDELMVSVDQWTDKNVADGGGTAPGPHM
jgi:hypothetical protein